MKFFLNGNSSSYLRHLETEFGESSNAIRVELNRFEDAGLLKSFMQGNKKYYQADQSHPLFPDINSIIFKYIGIDQIIEKVVHKLGKLDRVYLCGDFAQGIDGDIVDLIFIGDDINRQYLVNLVDKCEKMIRRRMRYIVYATADWQAAKERMNGEEVLLLWKEEGKGMETGDGRRETGRERRAEG